MPERIVIANTSPLLYLHSVRQVELFRALYGTIVVPDAVRAELQTGLKAGFSAPDVEQFSWIQVKAVQSRVLIPAIVDLGPGEAEVIALGLEHTKSVLVLDDLLARKVAALNHLTYTGTLGILLKAKQAGYLDALRPIVMALRGAGLWLDDDLVTTVLAQAGE
jgi:predicted nucleic acid-binding protein